MKINYREPTILEQMLEAAQDKSKYIESFELTEAEFNRHFSSFDKNVDLQGNTTYFYKGVKIKVIK